MNGELSRDVAASGVRLRVAEWPLDRSSQPPAEREPSAPASSRPRGERVSSPHRELDQPPIVMLHGMFQNRASWQRLVTAARGRYRFVAPDLPGFGDSEKPATSRYPYGIEAFSEAVADLFGGLEIGRAHVVGHGLGGAVALHLAARHPELVARLVLVDTLCYPSPLHPKLRLAATPLLGGLLFKQLLGRGAFRAFYRDRIAARVDGALIDAYYESLDSPAGRGALLATLRATLDTRNVIADSRLVQAPTLVVWGRDDRVVPAGFGRRLAKEIPNAGFELVDANHAPHEEEPEEVWRIISRFLDGQRAGSR
jgi:pimeloyl-ACP methyl ester carboxylesterase